MQSRIYASVDKVHAIPRPERSQTESDMKFENVQQYICEHLVFPLAKYTRNQKKRELCVSMSQQPHLLYSSVSIVSVQQEADSRPHRIVMQYDARSVENKNKRTIDNEGKGCVLQELAPQLFTRFLVVMSKSKTECVKKKRKKLRLLRRLTPPLCQQYATHISRKEKENPPS